eukprot:jgi/Mesvir1/11763/Mv25834-RA.1
MHLLNRGLRFALRPVPPSPRQQSPHPPGRPPLATPHPAARVQAPRTPARHPQLPSPALRRRHLGSIHHRPHTPFHPDGSLPAARDPPCCRHFSNRRHADC